MRRIFLHCLCMIGISFVVLMPRAGAQQIIPPGQFRIAGYPFNCGGIPTAIWPGGFDIAWAANGLINLNGMRFFSMPPSVQMFVYGHECAHYIVGANETAADCWAIKVGRQQGFINAAALQQICQSVWFSPGDWTHAPGPPRCQAMLACFSAP